jgi:signal transduction histidine kinase
MIALAALGIGIVLVFETTFGRGALFWPIVIGIGGVVLIWRQADEAQRERWLDTSGRIDPVRALVGRGTWASYARIAAGLALLLAALFIVGFDGGSLVEARGAVLAALLALVAIGFVVGPFFFRLASDLSAEREERVRSQERADVAAHLHDSVLQTLALIQKNADDGPTVARLARAQERDLRTWLFEEHSIDGTHLASALRGVAAEVEAGHQVVVEVVTVGDLTLTEAYAPLVRATREAVTNAAKHAGTGKVDVYAEVSPQAVEVFVKDRGVGFDPAGVAADRHGVRGSIIDRMERHGGSAAVRSTPGEGTEVVLRMPVQEEKP